MNVAGLVAGLSLIQQALGSNSSTQVKVSLCYIVSSGSAWVNMSGRWENRDLGVKKKQGQN